MKEQYLITYELNNSTKDYSIFYNNLKLLGGWWHYLPSIWIIKNCNLTANEISEKLLQFIDIDKDFLFIVEINTSNEQGWLPKKAWEWLESK